MRLKMNIMIMCFVALFVFGCTNTDYVNTSSFSLPNIGVVEGDFVKIPLSEISSKVSHYEYDADGVIVRYFIVLGSDGTPRTAFDACDVCGGSKGYEQVGSDISCRKCGRVFDIDGLGTQNKGYGCWPSFLPHVIEGDYVLISISDLNDGKHRF